MFYKKYKDNLYLKNILILTSGTILAQIVVVLCTPFITRLYTPEELGSFTLILTIITLFSPIMNGRYDISIVSGKDDNESKRIAIIGLIFTLLFSTIILFGLIIYETLFSTTFKDLGYWVYSPFFILIIVGITNVLTGFNNKYKQYNTLSQINVIRSVSQAFLQIILGIFKFSVIGLIISVVISNILSISKQYNKMSNNYGANEKINFRNLFQTFIKFKNQIIYSTPALLLNSLSYSILVFLISSLYGMKEVGYYSISFRMLGLPLSLISGNVAKVYFERASNEKKEHGSFFNTFKKTSLLLLVISIPIFSLLMLTSETIFEVIFGSGWGRAGLFVAILSPMFAIRFIVSALSLSLVIANKQKVELLLQGGFLIEALGSYVLAKIFNLDLEYFLIMISIFFSINYMLVYIVMFKVSKSNREQI